MPSLTEQLRTRPPRAVPDPVPVPWVGYVVIGVAVLAITLVAALVVRFAAELSGLTAG